MQTDFNLVLRIQADRPIDDLRNSIKSALLAAPNIASAELEDVQALGATTRETLVTVALAFATSIAANFATDQIKEVIENSGLGDTVAILSCNPSIDAVQVGAHSPADSASEH